MNVDYHQWSISGKVLLLFSFAFPTLGADVDSSLLLCREMQPAVARAHCYDQAIDRLTGKIVREPPVVPSQRELPTTNELPSIEAGTAVSPEMVFGKSQRETTRILMQNKLGEEDLDSLSTSVIEVKRDGLGRLTVVLENSQIWKQTDNTDLNLRTGDRIRIFRGLLDSYQLEKATGSRRIRVTRIE